jgi:nicotinate-nucleotide--dimethylbenzimidazole phosphoribosyltransferase
MSVDPPTGLTAVIERIVAPEERPADVPADVTGELARLLLWWRSLSEGTVHAQWIDDEPPTDPVDAVAAGVTAVERAVDAGATLIVPVCGARDEIAARTVMALLTRREASAVLPQPPGMPDRDWMATCAAVRDRAAAVVDLRGEPLSLLAALPAPGIAFAAGVLLGAAARHTPCLVDGTDELAAALVADRLSHRARGWWRAAVDSPDPGRAAAIDRVDLAAGLPLALTDDAGRGAQATLALLAALDESVTP